MAARRNALGRGLGALIPGREPASPAGPAGTRSARVDSPPVASEPDGAALEVGIDRIAPNPDQPRRRFEPAELDSLAESIRRHGILQPVVVRRLEPDADGDRYELVVGERRWRASRAAGRTAIPVVVADIAPPDRLELAIVENVQRHDLNPIELALAFRTLADSGATQDQIGERVGLDRSSVANHVRLLELSREVQEDVEAGKLSFGHARTLLSVSSPERRRHLHRRILADGLSVRAAEQAARASGAPRQSARRQPKDASENVELAHLVDRLRDRLQTRVRITGGPGRGRIEIEYFGLEDLNRISEELLR